MSIDFCDAGHVVSTEATFALASDGYFDHLDLDHLWPYEQVVALHLSDTYQILAACKSCQTLHDLRK